jgi:hypothetical protein
LAEHNVIARIRTALGYDTLWFKTRIGQVIDDSDVSLTQILTGKADLGPDGKLPVGQLPGAVTAGGLAYQGTFNAATGMDGGGAALPAPSAANKGYYWICDTAGTFQSVVFNPKDWAVSHGDRWDHVDNSDPTLAMLGCGYATSSTAAATAAKTTSAIVGFVRTVGGCVAVSFTYQSTAASPTLDVSGTGAAAVRCNGAAATADMIPLAGLFEWDGTYWQLLNPAPTWAEAAVTLAAASWTGSAVPWSYAISTTAVRITPTNLIHIRPAAGITDEALSALAAAGIDDTASVQAWGSITLKAYGTKPTVAIPIKLIAQAT